jgi:hypothetical protein
MSSKIGSMENHPKADIKEMITMKVINQQKKGSFSQRNRHPTKINNCNNKAVNKRKQFQTNKPKPKNLNNNKHKMKKNLKKTCQLPNHHNQPKFPLKFSIPLKTLHSTSQIAPNNPPKCQTPHRHQKKRSKDNCK